MKPLLLGQMLVLLALPAAFGQGPSSLVYSLTVETLSSGGQRVTSASYSADACLGNWNAMVSGSPEPMTLKTGYAGQLYDAQGLVGMVDTPLVSEGNSAQLLAEAVLDDNTLLRLQNTQVVWSVLSGPIAGVSRDGVATMSAVYQTSPASVAAAYLGFNAVIPVTVVNVGLDDFGIYAVDGINDAWQVTYFGTGNPDALPAADPDRDGQNNLLEYYAGVSPLDPLAQFRFEISTLSATEKQLVLSPRLPDRDYIVEYTPSLGHIPFRRLLTTRQIDSGNTRTIIDTNALDYAKFYRVKILLR